MGGADLGHAFTTGASQELYQMTGRTPGLSSGGGSSGVKKRREARLAQEAINRNAQRMLAEAKRMLAEANMGENILLEPASTRQNSRFRANAPHISLLMHFLLNWKLKEV
jgi:hypothetical protein